MGVVPFLVIFILPTLSVLGASYKGAWLLACPVFAFVLFPLFDFLGGVDANAMVQKERKSSAYRNILYLYVLVETACLVYSGKIFLSATPWERVGLIVQAGVVSGGMGISVAHELMHKNSRVSVFFAEILLIQVFYAHYLVEHVLGHHSHVATPNDPTTARLGESYYAFFPRTFFGSLKSVWNIEKKRLSRQQAPPFHYRNRALWYWGVQIILAAALTAVFGWPACVYYLGESFVAINLLEIINYTEHYGLTRNETAAGKYERVTEKHAWESRRRLTNFLLINLQLHSDHHIHPTKPYQELVSLDSPQLPAGYATMAVIALVPPLFRKIMDPRVKALSSSSSPTVLK